MNQIHFSPVNIHIYVASACDLACTYCWNQGGTFGGAHRGLMNLETAQATIDFVEGLLKTQKPGLMSFSFFGGEPLLNPRVLHYLIKEMLTLQQIQEVDLRLLIFSNGTTFDESLVELVRVHPNLEYHIGLDGRRETHDLYRVDHNGLGSFDRVVKNIGILKDHGVSVAAESVVLPPYDYDGLLRTYDELGIVFAYVQEEILPRHGAALDRAVIPEFSLEQWAKAYKGFTDLYFERLLSRTAPLIDPLFGIVKWFLPGNEPPHLACTAGTSQIAISHDGDIYACNQLLDVERFRLGNVFAGVKPESFRAMANYLVAKGRVVERNPACRSCKIATYCKGGCYARNLIATGEIGKIESEAMCQFRTARAAINWSFVTRMLSVYPSYIEDVINRNYSNYFPTLYQGDKSDSGICHRYT